MADSRDKQAFERLSKEVERVVKKECRVIVLEEMGELVDNTVDAKIQRMYEAHVAPLVERTIELFRHYGIEGKPEKDDL